MHSNLSVCVRWAHAATGRAGPEPSGAAAAGRQGDFVTAVQQGGEDVAVSLLLSGGERHDMITVPMRCEAFSCDSVTPCRIYVCICVWLV